MHVTLQVGLEPFSLQNKYGGIMLFLIISCLALVPLATLYILLVVTCFLFSEMVVYEEGEHDFTFSSALAALRICTQATLYFSLSFPFMVALLSTFGCYHILEARRRVVYSTDTGSPSVDFSPIIWLYLQRYSMTVTEESIEKCIACHQQTDDQILRIPRPGVANDDKIAKRITRCVPGECAICQNQYTEGDSIVWSCNPKCVHCYHYDCIVSWMAPWEPRNRLCPCCRELFMGETTTSIITKSEDGIGWNALY